MSGEVIEAPAQVPVPVQIDRQLVARDLERLSGVLVPLMLRSLSSLRSWRPRLGVGPFSREVPAGELLYDRLRVYLQPTISGALASVGALSDGELRDLCAVIASELGAWCLANAPLTDDQLAIASPALGHLLGTLDEPSPDVDWSDLESTLSGVPRET